MILLEVPMKLKSIIVATFICVSASAFAQWFPARVQILSLPGQISAEVYNPYYQPIICNGQVFGQTFHGPVYSSFFAQQILPAGGFRYAFVQTNAYSHFVSGWAEIYCQFL